MLQKYSDDQGSYPAAAITYYAFFSIFPLLLVLTTGVRFVITLLTAEATVVATRRLWPRSFSLVLEQPATRADERALRQRGKIERSAARTRR